MALADEPDRQKWDNHMALAEWVSWMSCARVVIGVMPERSQLVGQVLLTVSHQQMKANLL